MPSKAHDERFIDWYVWYSRRSASPAEAVAFHRMMMDGDVRDVLPAVRCPTLVFHRTASREEVSDIASRIEGRSWSRFPDWWTASAGRTRARTRSCSTRPVALSEASTARRSSTESSRRCCSPTSWDRRRGPASSATKAGGACSAVITKPCGVLEQYRGCEVGTAGDGLATFDGLARAVRAAVDAREAVRPLASRSAQAFTQARSRSLEATSRGSPCTRARAQRRSPL